MRNAYFQIVKNDRGTLIRFYPPLNGGGEINIEELIHYLKREGIGGYDIGSIRSAMQKGKEETAEVLLPSGEIQDIPERMLLKTAKADMYAVVRFYPPSSGMKRMEKWEIVKNLEELGIKYGINEKVIDTFISNPKYCTNYVVARGKPMIPEKNAVITYHFNTDVRIKPKRNEDGSVNFHELNNISHIKAGDVLATMTPAYLGEEGISVKGQVIRPKPVNNPVFHYGLNISVSEDGLQLISGVNGHATLQNGQVFVSDVYDVPGDVDNSTGDIDYEGNVLVHGSVRTGFSVKASGNIEVMGSIEGAVISAGGQIILHHGMQGMGRGILRAGSNVVARFLESATVEAGGYVEADSVIQCKISAKGDINVNGRKGFIIGGSIRSASMVSAKTIGSMMEIATIVEVGLDPTLKDRFDEGIQQLKKKNEQLVQIAANVEAYRKRKRVGNLDDSKAQVYIQSLAQLKEIREEIENLNKEVRELMEDMGENGQACVKVSRDIYPGVRLIISEEQMVIKQLLCHCKFVKERGTIQSLPL